MTLQDQPPAIAPTSPAPPLAPDGRPLASFGDRLDARVRDWVVAGVVGSFLAVSLVGALFVVIGSAGFSEEDGTLAVVALFGAFLLLLVGLYYWYEVEYQLRHDGQTIGKRAAKIQVAPLLPGQRLTRGMLARRWLVWIVGGALVPGLAIVDGLSQLWDGRYRQCLHDRFARTVVVRAVAR